MPDLTQRERDALAARAERERADRKREQAERLAELERRDAQR